MGKNVLVIGGSYFFGRVFSILASKDAGFSLTLLNRGRYAMTSLPNVTEYHCDRHDGAALQSVPAAHYDAIVDFCAYTPGDISSLLENLPCTADRYIFISTADVYERGLPAPPDETALLMQAPIPGPVGEYIWNKILLERELAEVCGKRGMSSVIFRPAFLYGPYNYAPREIYFFEKIVRGDAIPFPTDAAGKFQFVYVRDAAMAVIAVIEKGQHGNAVYNLAAPEVLDYPAFFEALRTACDLPVKTLPVTVWEVEARRIPLPFPLTAAENECYTATKAVTELGVRYTPFAEGLSKAYQSVKNVFTGR